MTAPLSKSERDHLRYVANAGVYRERARQYRAANKEKVRAYGAQYRARVGHAAYMRQYRAANPERAARGREYNRDWHSRNADKVAARHREDYNRTPEKHRARSKEWRARNPHLVTAQTRLREATKARRTPTWADLRKIERLYEEARWLTVLMGEPYHVDHVIPLRGKKVSGLHVHNNLQILPGVENVRKSNRFEVA